MAVLTISREYASGGAIVGRKAAALLGYHFVDKKIMEEAFRQYGFIPLESTYESVPGFWDRFDRIRTLTMQNLNHVLEGMAHHGNVVILGRGSFALLGGYADVLNVRIKAPLERRVERLMEEEGISDWDEPETVLFEKDRVRIAFVESSYHVRWDAINHFDMVLDTEKIEPDTAAALLADAVRSMKVHPGDARPTTESIEVEPYMAAAVRGALAPEPAS